MATRDPIYFTVGRRSTPGTQGFGWRIWAAKTSFYIKPRHHSVAPWKISLHGPDEAIPGGGGAFHAKLDPGPRNFSGIVGDSVDGFLSGTWPITFSGMAMPGGSARLALRFRTTFDVVTRLPRVPLLDVQTKKSLVADLIPPPLHPGTAMDLDVIVSSGQPYWHGAAFFRSAGDPRLGILENDAAQFLTAQVFERIIGRYPAPPSVQLPKPAGRGDETRAYGVGVDEVGVLWIVEQRASRDALERFYQPNSTE